ncbi:MAG TPA: 7-cyano-7-deazaguanine synthase [Methanocorpusculum sp.]|nr:7-cyano-7-deazaguanine synthase [Methanocorpusculum sp.]
MNADFGGVSSALIALSGGVDSSVLLHLAMEAGIRVDAACVVSEFTAESDIRAAEAAAKREDVPFHLLRISLLDDSKIMKNQESRCYLCKRRMAETLMACAEELGLSAVFEGTNADDGIRPGLSALQEAGVKSPLLSVSKKDICDAAASFGIPIPPPSACLATRIPYGTPLTKELLSLVERAEGILRDAGVSGILRVRLKNMHEAVVETDDVSRYSAKFFEEKLTIIGIENVSVEKYVCGGAEWIKKQ